MLRANTEKSRTHFLFNQRAKLSVLGRVESRNPATLAPAYLHSITHISAGESWPRLDTLSRIC